MAPGAYILGCSGPELSPDEASFFRDADPWGFIVFDRNLETPEQIRSLTGALRDSVGRDAPILIDQEGGRVQRLWPPGFRRWRPPLDQVREAGEAATRSMYLRYRLIAEELYGLGIDVNCAPIADIAGENTHPILLNRCYGRSVDTVVPVARAVATGLIAGGVLPVLKHIPGHGRGTADSHLELPVVDASPEDLQTTDFAAFGALADLPLGMTAHIVYSAFDPAHPATTSERMIRLIRDEIGFDGLLMTDDISMEALGGPMRARAEASLAAGCDLVLHCNGDMAEMTEIAGAAGRMGPMAANRAERALTMRLAPEPIDIPAAEAELEALLQGRVYDRDG